MKVTEQTIENQLRIVTTIEKARDDLIERFLRENKLLILMREQYRAEKELEEFEAEYKEKAIRGLQ